MPKLSLRTKVLISLIIFVFIFLGFTGFVSQKIFLTSFSELENREAIKSIERSKVVFDRQIFNLDSRLTDWAVWDDTYYFVKNKNQDYIDSNLTDESLRNLGINAMFFIASSGAIVYEKQINVQTKEDVSALKDLENILLKSKNISSFESLKDKHSGVIQGLSGPVLFAARPILTSEATGPIAGTLIFIRYYDKELKDYFEKLNNNNEIDILDYESTTLGKYAKAKEQLDLGKKYYAFPLSSDKIGGFTLIYDYNNKPVYILENELPSVISNLGRESVVKFLYFIVFLSISGIIFILLLLNKFVISKITNLNKDINNLENTTTTTTYSKLSGTGNDEFANIASNINNLIDKIQKSQEDLKKGDEELKAEKANLDQKVLELEKFNKLTIGRELKMIELKNQLEEIRKDKLK